VTKTKTKIKTSDEKKQCRSDGGMISDVALEQTEYRPSPVRGEQKVRTL